MMLYWVSETEKRVTIARVVYARRNYAQLLECYWMLERPVDKIAYLGCNEIKIMLYGGESMNIRPSAAIRQNYNEIAELCRKTAEPGYLTKNGEGDLVVMDIESFNRREKMLKLREELLAVEEDRLAGRTGCTADELDAYLDSVIAGA